VKDARSLVGCATFPSSATPVHPFVTGWSSVGFGDFPASESEPIETHVRKPPREEEPRPEDQGAFHRQQPARYPWIAPQARARVGLPSRRPYGRDIAKRRDHRSRWGKRASALYALAGEHERLLGPTEPPRPDERSDSLGSVGRIKEEVSLFVGAGPTAAPLTVSTV